MQYKIGDHVSINVEYEKSGIKRILSRQPLKGSTIIVKIFPIVMLNHLEETYSIMIDDDMIGWTISNFHVENNGADKKFVGKKFYDVTDDMIDSVKGPLKKKLSEPEVKIKKKIQKK
ncbi:hypothetical protein UFOVP1290_329 [uncultured Caudovirales phage]|uniref:Uncharacterized protein n=1 Tax=uncultured Caudovirales phage TaxID=2100421 RepID=A0A6J5RIJ5_9CAUD|nr:hypothetical protein UFOVP1290_329 [uncultured Caudovirales phage]